MREEEHCLRQLEDPAACSRQPAPAGSTACSRSRVCCTCVPRSLHKVNIRLQFAVCTNPGGGLEA